MSLQKKEAFTVTSSIIRASPLTDLARARRGLLFFFAFLVPLSALSEGLTITTRSLFSPLLLMWTPALAAIATRLLLREGFSDVSFRLRGRRTFQAIGLAILVPALVGLIAYGIAWLTHVAPFLPFHASENLTLFIAFPDIPSPLLMEFLALLYLTVVEVLTATGEEIGWRGYMLPRLIAARCPAPVLVSGLIWSFWHWPLILFSPAVAGLPQIVTASIFLVTITSLGCISARLRLATGSIWPAIFLHAAWNCCIVEIYDAFTKGTDTSLWTGEAGILVALTMVVTAFLFSFWKG